MIDGRRQAATGPDGSEPVVSVRGLVKRYGSHEAVAGIDFEVRRGEIFAFLGPNGAGKSTTVEILEGFRHHPLHGRGGIPGRPITVLSAGHIVAEGTPRTLGGRDHMTTAIRFTLPDHVQARDLPPGLSPLTEPGPGGSTVLHSESPLVHLQMLGNWAVGRGFDLPDLDVHRPTLEEVYLSLTDPASKKDQR